MKHFIQNCGLASTCFSLSLSLSHTHTHTHTHTIRICTHHTCIHTCNADRNIHYMHKIIYAGRILARGMQWSPALPHEPTRALLPSLVPQARTRTYTYTRHTHRPAHLRTPARTLALIDRVAPDTVACVPHPIRPHRHPHHTPPPQYSTTHTNRKSNHKNMMSFARYMAVFPLRVCCY